MRHRTVWLLALIMATFLIGAGCSTTSSNEPHATADPMWTENANIIRRVEGSYTYLNLDDGTVRGNETFSLSVHPSGARTMTASTNIFSRDVHVTSTLVANERFRPVHALVSVWTQGRLKGNGHYRFSDTSLLIQTEGEGGAFTETLNVPDHVSLISHPIALDGWHFWYVEPGATVDGSLYYIDGSADFDTAMGGRLMSAPLTSLGTEIRTVPAGTFEAEGFRIADHSEIWIATEDRLVVEYIWEALNRRYVLQTLETHS